MDINVNKEASTLNIALVGRLDTVTAPDLEKVVREMGDDVKALNFDFANLEYISSAGLRVLLAAQKIMNAQGEMVISNVSDDIMEIFNITGFTDILTIK